MKENKRIPDCWHKNLSQDCFKLKEDKEFLKLEPKGQFLIHVSAKYFKVREILHTRMWIEECLLKN